MATCRQCKNFIEPAPQYESDSMGSCKVMITWESQYKNRPVPAKKYDQNYASLGGKLYWPHVERDCKKFIAKS